MCISRVICFILCLSSFNSAISETIFTYREKESPNDTRYEFDRRLMDLALQKTEATYGPYKLMPSYPGSNEKRVINEALLNKYENYFFKSSITPELINSLGYVPFPIDRGVVGYRVAFTSEATTQQLKHVQNLDDIKQFSILQGVGWLDVEILKHHGFKIVTSSHYDSMFKMIARDRAHLFLRGINEVLDEWSAQKNIKNLVLDDNIVIQYPLPRFLFTNKANQEAIKRMHEGILIAYKDGSFQKLWEEEYQASIEFANLKKRKIFKIENPIIKNLDKSFEQYNFSPITQ